MIVETKRMAAFEIDHWPGIRRDIVQCDPATYCFTVTDHLPVCPVLVPRGDLSAVCRFVTQLVVPQADIGNIEQLCTYVSKALIRHIPFDSIIALPAIIYLMHCNGIISRIPITFVGGYA